MAVWWVAQLVRVALKLYNPPMRSLVLPLCLGAMLLAACAGAQLTPTATPTQETPPTVGATTPVPTVAPTPVAFDTPTPTPLAVTATPTPTPVSEPMATPTPTPVAPATPAPTPIVAYTLTQVNLRQGPGRGYPVIGVLGAGQAVIVLEQNPAGDWIRVALDNGEDAWVAASLLDLPAGVTLPVATALPTPPPTPTPGDQVRFGAATITLPTYPWEAFTTPAYDEAARWPYRRFDRRAYEAAAPSPQRRRYRLLTLENRWVWLSFMPDLGGRLYELVFKPTGNNELYRNPVIKPSPWGPGPEGNGWLAAGGIEWALPVPEHGYAWAEPWGYITEPDPPAGAITLFTADADRLQLNVRAGLQPDSAAFTLAFSLENRADGPVTVSYWTNAMLAPGPANRVGPNLRFYVPGDRMMVHSADQSDLPPAGGVFSWPFVNGREVRRLGTWEGWLGFFAYPQAQAGWAAVYDTAADEGVVRVFPPHLVPGLKGFGLGWSRPIPPAAYTDDDSSYVEMQGGLTPTYDQSLTLAPGESRRWQEVWYPVAGIGGLSAADANGAVHLTRTATGLRLRLFGVTSRRGELVVADAGGELWRGMVALDPAHPADLNLPAGQPPLRFVLTSTDGSAWALGDLYPDEGD